MSYKATQPEQYPALLAEKAEGISTLLTPFCPQTPLIVPSEKQHYRMRAEFRLWHEDDDLFYAMFDPSAPKTPLRVDNFDVADPKIVELMPLLREALLATPELRHRVFQVEFLATTLGECIITLAYHRKLNDDWISSAKPIAEKLGVSMIGRARKQRLVIDKDYVMEELTIKGRRYRYQQIENSFTQPNAGVNTQMISWAVDAATECSGDLLELYCGNGNFTLPLSTQFNKVLATEVSKTSTAAAHFNLQENSINNISMARMSAEEMTQAMNGEREFRRLRDIDLNEYNLKTLFVDPPRAGLDADTTALAARFDSIIYVSCNPQTLADNLIELTKTHSVKQWAMFDQFPYTHHMECGVLLQRK